MSHVFHARLHLLGWPQKQWHPLYVACKAVDKVIADAETPHLQHALLGKRIECAVDMMQSKLMLRGMLSATNKLASCRQLKALHACIPADAGVHWPLVYTGTGNQNAGCCQKQQHKSAMCGKLGVPYSARAVNGPK